MIRSNSKKLSRAARSHLSEKHQLVLNEVSFEDQVKKADALWDSKDNAAFDEIKRALASMCVGQNLCVYCEANEATDIEHIFPKKLFPERAFIWSNYLWACNKCNSHLKKDKFKVFNPALSDTVLDVTCPPKTYIKPPTADSCFINQREEDPMEFIELDILNRQFVFTERHPEETREYHKAFYTIDLLHLNKRELPDKRRQAFLFYKDRLEKYVETNEAWGFGDLEIIVEDTNYRFKTPDFEKEKDKLLMSIKKDIISYAHPTVWKEMIRQRANLPTVNALLNQAPAELLTWI